MKVKHKSIYCDTYLCNVFLYYGCDFLDYKAHMLKNEIDVSLDNDVDDSQVFGQVGTGEDGFYIFIGAKANLYHVAHECIHLVMFIFRRANVSIGMDANQHEHFAYEVQKWLKKIWEIVKK
jgi:hypothetical protein